MRPLLRVLPCLALLAGGAGLAGCGSSPSTGDKGYVDDAGIVTRLPVGERRTPGPVTGTTLEGKRISLSAYAGKVVVLNVWGSWCPPCRKEAPQLAAAAKQLTGSGGGSDTSDPSDPSDVVFLGIDTKDASPQQGLAYQRRYDVPYPSLYDPSGRNLLAFAGTLNPSAIPSTVVLDRRGRVAASVLGGLPSTQTLVDVVQDVAK
ncbi:MAG: TlpA family protein disulfide reductase [Marmoricola sp.]|nr:TlpA family protein disulfide reductase [Marmoricola sp.]